jgi:hypothetical protein
LDFFNSIGTALTYTGIPYSSGERTTIKPCLWAVPDPQPKFQVTGDHADPLVVIDGIRPFLWTCIATPTPVGQAARWSELILSAGRLN